MFTLILAWILLLWYVIMLTAAFCGFYSIYTRFHTPPEPSLPPGTYKAQRGHAHAAFGDTPGSAKTAKNSKFSRSTELAESTEPVSIIRPVKGIDPELFSCLESSFLQNYPADMLQIIFCVADAADAALPLLQSLLRKYSHIDAQILVSAPGEDYYGPNPKVNNLAKGFRAAKYDLVWIMDSNVWASRNLLANSAHAMAQNTNCGKKLGPSSRRVKLVHHVPLALALDRRGSDVGSLLDEMFLFTSHSKFYVSLNNLSIAPCVNGKSNFYRRSDLDYAVSQIPLRRSPFFSDPQVVQDAHKVSAKGPGHGMEFFAKYIGEDNMIGIALWEYCHGRTALTGDIVVQPLGSGSNILSPSNLGPLNSSPSSSSPFSSNPSGSIPYYSSSPALSSISGILAQSSQTRSIREYCNRRVRWLRVRKYMVLAATLVEPTTESIICGIMGTFALSKLVFGCVFSARFFAFHMACWLVCDYWQYHLWARNISTTRDGPQWLLNVDPSLRPSWQWLKIWLMREFLALPIWVAAMVGHEIEWRGKPFMIKKDLSVEEL